MSALMQRVAGGIGSMLHRPQRRPARPCEYGRHTYPKAAVDRDNNGVYFCPGCGAQIGVEPLTNGLYRVLPHRRRPSVTVVTVRGVDR